MPLPSGMAEDQVTTLSDLVERQVRAAPDALGVS
jgi:hypothetical protein